MNNTEAIRKLIRFRRILEKGVFPVGYRFDAEPFDLAISALEKQTCDGCIFNKRWKEDNCIDCARKAIDKYQRPLPEPYTEEES